VAKNDNDLFERLRRAGVRKQVAKTLSGIGEGASKKAVRAARSAVSELRSLADEIERRLPSAQRSRSAPANQGRRAQRPAASRRRSPGAPRPKTTAAAGTNGARAPRGQNKAMILASLKSGPKTASEIAKETGIGTGTVSSTLSKMATTGELTKADRGYELPS
jgi:alkaline phosphatase